MKVLLVTGDRHATKNTPNTERWEPIVRNVLVAFLAKVEPHEPRILIHGACGLDGDHPDIGQLSGIDRLADLIGKELGFLVAAVPANWTTDNGKAAGPKRNARMIAHVTRLRTAGATVATAAFHDELWWSKGTKNTVELSRGAGIKTVCFRTDGTHEVVFA